MKYLKIFLNFLILAFGVFIFIFGGYDDSPGAQLLGVLIFAYGVFRIVRKKNS